MIVAGKTIDGKIVVTDVFKYVDTHGIPLDYLLTFLHDRNMEMDWLAFFLEARSAGWNVQTIKAKSVAAVFDAFGRSERTRAITERINNALDQFI